MKLNDKNIFLVDAIGALVSAALIGLVLPIFISWIGLPIEVLNFLAVIALAYASFSFFCYWFVERVSRFLLIIIFANLLYCAFTALIVVIFSDEITNLGRIYFVAEILIILMLVAVERSVYRKGL